MRKLKVAVLFGGRSGEHEVSVASASSVIQAMDPNRYEILPVGITKEGRWLTSGEALAALTSGVVEADVEEASSGLVSAAGSQELVPGSGGEFPSVDVVFPVLHGTYGEDGSVQGLLELAGLPYVGSGILGSALGLDKVAQKSVLRDAGLPIVEAMLVARSRWVQDPDGVIADAEGRHPYPLFVKPANLGSSVGVSKAHDREGLRAGLTLAARFDRRLVVERAIDAREIECSVLGNDDPEASVVGEVVPCNEFYDYRAKYVDDDSELCIPADLPPETSEAIRHMAVQAFLALDCAGMARADFFVCRKTGEIYINELNTIPGFTRISMYPKLWEATGLPYPQLVDRLIDLALSRHAEMSELERSYGYDH